MTAGQSLAPRTYLSRIGPIFFGGYLIACYVDFEPPLPKGRGICEKAAADKTQDKVLCPGAWLLAASRSSLDDSVAALPFFPLTVSLSVKIAR